MNSVASYRLSFPLALKRASSPSVQIGEKGNHSPVRGACPSFPFLPRFPLLGRRRICPNEFVIGQTLAIDTSYNIMEASGIIILTIVEAESLFIKIPSLSERGTKGDFD